ncbi:UNVERIFIED_CONTAM: hypothetical protein DES50_10544 [Williamsia faeni]
MSDTETLRRLTRRLDQASRRRIIDEQDWEGDSETVERATDGSELSIVPLSALIDEVGQRKDVWPDASESDRWLAPRVHNSLRLTRSDASDQDLWAWLATRFNDYVEWRWGARGEVAQNRWRGPIHKQAFARLWWGAELFRDGSDYAPVERAFVFQDLPNSYLHRPLIRCRSLALGVVELITPNDQPGASTIANPTTADDINDLARVLNLATAGSPPEAETGFQRDDFRNYLEWVVGQPEIPGDWNAPVTGPNCTDTSDSSRQEGYAIANRGWSYAHSAAANLGTRSAQRRQQNTSD